MSHVDTADSAGPVVQIEEIAEVRRQVWQLDWGERFDYAEVVGGVPTGREVVCIVDTGGVAASVRLKQIAGFGWNVLAVGGGGSKGGGPEKWGLLCILKEPRSRIEKPNMFARGTENELQSTTN